MWQSVLPVCQGTTNANPEREQIGRPEAQKRGTDADRSPPSSHAADKTKEGA